MLKLNDKSVDYGVNKLTDFVKVHRDASQEDKLNAVDNFAQGAGLSLEAYNQLTDRMEKIVDSPSGELGWAVIGAVIGLYIAEHAIDELT